LGGGIYHEFEFPLLFCGGDGIPDNRRGKAALWTDPQPVVFDITAGFGNPRAKPVETFQIAFLGRDQPQNNKPVGGKIRERSK
jgi:hypothetical protein